MRRVEGLRVTCPRLVIQFLYESPAEQGTHRSLVHFIAVSIPQPVGSLAAIRLTAWRCGTPLDVQSKISSVDHSTIQSA